MQINPNTSDLDKGPALPNAGQAAGGFVKEVPPLSSARDGMVSAKLQDQLPGRCWVLLGSPPDASYQMPSMSGRPSLGCSAKSTIICVLIL